MPTSAEKLQVTDQQAQINESPDIREAEVMHSMTARIGSRVRHAGQQYTGRATATVTGFTTDDTMHDTEHPGHPWIKVLVEHDKPCSGYDSLLGWDWDRTLLIEP